MLRGYFIISLIEIKAEAAPLSGTASIIFIRNIFYY